MRKHVHIPNHTKDSFIDWLRPAISCYILFSRPALPRFHSSTHVSPACLIPHLTSFCFRLKPPENSKHQRTAAAAGAPSHRNRHKQTKLCYYRETDNNRYTQTKQKNYSYKPRITHSAGLRSPLLPTPLHTSLRPCSLSLSLSFLSPPNLFVSRLRAPQWRTSYTTRKHRPGRKATEGGRGQDTRKKKITAEVVNGDKYDWNKGGRQARPKKKIIVLLGSTILLFDPP